MPLAWLPRTAECKGGEAGTGATRSPKGEHGEDPPLARREHGGTLHVIGERAEPEKTSARKGRPLIHSPIVDNPPFKERDL